MQLQLGFTPLHSGLMLLPAALTGIVAKRWIATLVKHYGYRGFLLVNTLVVGSAIMAFSLIDAGTPLVITLVVLAVFGAANSMRFAAMNSVTLKDLSHSDAGSGNSLFSMVQMLAMGLGVSIGGGIVHVLSVRYSSAMGFRLVFICVGLVTLFSALVFRLLESESEAMRQIQRAPQPAEQ